MKFSTPAAVVIFLSFLMAGSVFVPFVLAAGSADSASAIASARVILQNCYTALEDAENVGANISPFLDRLNTANSLLSNAETAYAEGNFDAAQNLAVQSQQQLESFLSDLSPLKDAAAQQQQQDFLLYVVLSLVGAFAILGAGTGMWLRHRNNDKPLWRTKVNIRKHKIVFFCTIAALSLLVASPAIQRLAFTSQQSYSFSELELLGPQHTAQYYPTTVKSGESYTIFIDVKNQLGNAAYYMVQMKLRTQTQYDAKTYVPSIRNATAFTAQNQTWSLPLVFSLNYTLNPYTSRVNLNSVTLNSQTINLPDFTETIDPQRGGYFGYLTFELWLYNSTLGDFQYNERFVELPFNMTAPT